MSKKKGWRPIFDQDGNKIGNGDFGNGHDHKPAGRIFRVVLIVATIAFGIGYWANTQSGREWRDKNLTGFSPAQPDTTR